MRFSCVGSTRLCDVSSKRRSCFHACALVEIVLEGVGSADCRSNNTNESRLATLRLSGNFIWGEGYRLRSFYCYGGWIEGNAYDFAGQKVLSRSHNAVIRVCDEAGNVIETHEHGGRF